MQKCSRIGVRIKCYNTLLVTDGTKNRNFSNSTDCEDVGRYAPGISSYTCWVLVFGVSVCCAVLITCSLFQGPPLQLTGELLWQGDG